MMVRTANPLEFGRQRPLVGGEDHDQQKHDREQVQDRQRDRGADAAAGIAQAPDMQRVPGPGERDLRQHERITFACWVTGESSSSWDRKPPA